MTDLRTERLQLRPVRMEEVDELHRLFLRSEVARFLLDGQTVPVEWVREEVRTSEERFGREGEAGLWAVRLAPSRSEGAGPIVGIVGFRAFFDDGVLQLLYALRPESWGRGFATEAARAACAYAFDALGFDEVTAATDAPNAASIRVLERIGMRRWKTEASDPWTTVYYRLGAGDRP